MDLLASLRKLFEASPSPFEFKDEWRAYLKQNLPIYSKIPESMKTRLHEKMGTFIRTTFFEGCNGIDLNDEMILTVSAQACILTLGHSGAPYPTLNTVLLYPGAFKKRELSVGAGGTMSEREVQCLGESWSNGTVILAWNAVTRGANNLFDGHNVTFHEFAHQLDSLNGRTDGAPPLKNEAAYQTWATVINEHSKRFRDRVERGRKTLLDPYGTLNPAEYFAVATEAFFEKPRQMKKKQPRLYEELQNFYKLDPAEWF